MEDWERRWHHVSCLQQLVVAAVDAPDRRPTFYPDWTCRAVMEHVLEIHRLAVAVVSTGATERPTGLPALEPDRPVELVAIELLGLANRLHEVVAQSEGRRVWALGAQRPAAFWLRRALSETVLHRGDIESATGGDPSVPVALAEECIDEFLVVRVLRHLERERYSGSGSVGLVSEATGWSVDLGRRTVLATCSLPDEQVVRGGAADLWHWLNRRGTQGTVQQGAGAGPRRLAGVLGALRRASQ